MPIEIYPNDSPEHLLSTHLRIQIVILEYPRYYFHYIIQKWCKILTVISSEASFAVHLSIFPEIYWRSFKNFCMSFTRNPSIISFSSSEMTVDCLTAGFEEVQDEIQWRN